MTKTCCTCADAIPSTLPCAEHLLERVTRVELQDVLKALGMEVEA